MSHIRHYRVLPWATEPLESIAKVYQTVKSQIFYPVYKLLYNCTTSRVYNIFVSLVGKKLVRTKPDQPDPLLQP